MTLEEEVRTGITYSVLIRRNATGEERLVPMGDDIHWHDASLYWWTDGNFGCDSNRLQVWRSDDEGPLPEMPDADMDDGDTHYCDTDHFTVVKAVLSDGREIRIDPPVLRLDFSDFLALQHAQKLKLPLEAVEPLLHP